MIEQALDDSIGQSLKEGRTKEEIYKSLLNQGYRVDAINENYPSPPSREGDDTQKKTINSILTIAAILVGAGVFSFIASNWQFMPKTIKVLLIVSFMLGSYTGGWYMKARMKFVKTGEALILLGVIIFGAGIFLIGQMFNIRANWPDGFLLWMLGTIALGYALEFYPAFYLAVILGIIALVAHPFILFDEFGGGRFLMTSTFLLMTSTVVTFVTGWAIRKKL